MSSPAPSPLAPVADAHAAAYASGRRRRLDLGTIIDALVLCAVTLAGLFSPVGPLAFYEALAVGFAGIATVVLVGAGLVTLVAERRSDRLQGVRRAPALVARGVRDTSIAAWVAACLLAWPLSRLMNGLPTGLTWSLEAAGGPLRAVLQTLIALVVLDAWLYWKHRLLHTRWLFPFHRGHHGYRDPTAFAGFAVGPVESVLTFWPVVIWAHPLAVHWAPLYFGLVIAFVALNFYLHCGVSSRVLEATLPRVLLNTSRFHNRHHANAEVNFGEALTLWDRLCRTREEDRIARRR